MVLLKSGAWPPLWALFTCQKTCKGEQDTRMVTCPELPGLTQQCSDLGHISLNDSQGWGRGFSCGSISGMDDLILPKSGEERLESLLCLSPHPPLSTKKRLQAGSMKGSYATPSAMSPLSPLLRWYIYALHGYFTEVTFTAVWAFVEHRDWRLQGVTSIWAFFIYGTFFLALEHLFLLLKDHWDLLARCTLYTLCIYLWEFSTGYLLRLFHACPWDYSGFRCNFMGLVTLEYFPFWFLGSLLFEKIVIPNTLRLRLDEAQRPQGRPIQSAQQKHH